ncbi:MAG TPA: transglutaminase-like cysteine peptidase [Bosea sp. (in: a-proteobacteria)]|uniref:transglutaminase-like cysteine peptidase n=1 Tax=Bosea sp. (in: a-proteobacteria) TaxID=1871050 RepID=UPI002E0F867A|nr:transglutaminase-like cysteine peptidase [Bosea sp. (in: a-proteobacteria)]
MPKRDPFSHRGYVQFGTTNATVVAKWSAAQKDVASDLAVVDRCGAAQADCPAAARTLLNIANEAQALASDERVAFVNRTVNRAIRYASDLSRHGVVDVWSSPLKVIGGFGDCEDYAIAKYALLRRLGVSADDIRILLVWDQRALEDHAVLAVRRNGSWLMLDNRYDEIAEDTDATHFRPIFALQDAVVSLFAAPMTNMIDHDNVAPASGWAGEEALAH